MLAAAGRLSVLVTFFFGSASSVVGFSTCVSLPGSTCPSGRSLSVSCCLSMLSVPAPTCSPSSCSVLSVTLAFTLAFAFFWPGLAPLLWPLLWVVLLPVALPQCYRCPQEHFHMQQLAASCPDCRLVPAASVEGNLNEAWGTYYILYKTQLTTKEVDRIEIITMTGIGPLQIPHH